MTHPKPQNKPRPAPQKLSAWISRNSWNFVLLGLLLAWMVLFLEWANSICAK